MTILNKLKANETHYPVFTLNWKEKQSLTILKLDIPTFDPTITNETSFSPPFTFLATDFTAQIEKGAVLFELKIRFLPLECKSFNDGQSIFDIDNETQSIHFELPTYCSPMNNWLRIKNRPKKRLSITAKANGTKELYDDVAFTVALDRRKIYTSNSRLTLFADDFERVYLSDTEYIYLEIKRSEKLTENVTKIVFDIKLKWTNRCDCDNEKISIGETPVEIKSPNYPQNYCNNLHCRYDIMAPKGSSIVIEVKDYQMTGDGYDILSFRYLHRSLKMQTRTYFDQFSVYSPHRNITIDQNAIILEFTTDNRLTNKGFSLVLKYKLDEPGIIKWIIWCVVIGLLIVGGITISIYYGIKKSHRFSNQVFMRFKNENEESGENIQIELAQREDEINKFDLIKDSNPLPILLRDQ